MNRLHGYDGVVMNITWKNAYIWEVYVEREYRSMGIGTVLIGEVLEHLEQIGIERVSLIVNSWNEEAQNFFKRLGLRPLRTPTPEKAVIEENRRIHHLRFFETSSTTTSRAWAMSSTVMEGMFFPTTCSGRDGTWMKPAGMSMPLLAM